MTTKFFFCRFFFNRCEKTKRHSLIFSIFQMSNRIFFCLANCFVGIACLQDFDVVKSILIFVFLFEILSRFVSNVFSRIFFFLNSFFLSFCLSLSIFTASSNVFLFDLFLFASIFCSFVGNFLQLFDRSSKFRFVHSNEFAEFIGFALGIFIVKQSISLDFLLVSIFLLVVTLRLRAFHSFILLVFNLFYFYFYFSPSSYVACGTFLVRIFSRSIIELYFVSLTSMERWFILLQLSKSYRRIFQRFFIGLYFFFTIFLSLRHRTNGSSS